jgi:hypothetical protein
LSYRTRWYDRNPVVFDAMSTWEGFPPNLQNILADYIQGLIRRRQLSFKLVGSFRSLFRYSQKRLTIYYQSKKKRRWYDEDPLVQSTVNTMALMAYEDLIGISHCILNLRIYLEQLFIRTVEAPEHELQRIVTQVFSKFNTRFY